MCICLGLSHLKIILWSKFNKQSIFVYIQNFKLAFGFNPEEGVALIRGRNISMVRDFCSSTSAISLELEIGLKYTYVARMFVILLVFVPTHTCNIF